MKIEDIIEENKLDAILVTSPISIRYLTKFKGTEGLLVVTNEKQYLFVDSRYYEQAQNECPKAMVILYDSLNLFTKLNQLLRDNRIINCGFEGDKVSVMQHHNYQRQIQVGLIPISLAKIRMIKTNEELDLIREACRITDEAYLHILDFVKIGMSEKEVAIELQKFILDKGAEGLAFETIVASGVRGSMPHGVASEKLIEENDFVTIDFGVFYKGYASDMTRTFLVGQKPNKKMFEIFEVVKQAQARAIEAIKPGVNAKDIDKIARSYISEKGYSQYFNHGTGHSIGLEIHELPNVNATSEVVLEAGHVITIEPGIYVPKLGGVRIEDDVIVTQAGHVIINKSSKELIIVDGR